MKVLMISKSQVVGAYHGKLREIAKLGVDLTVVVPPRWGKQQLEIREAAEYKIHVLPCVLSGHNHLHFYASRFRLSDVDLVHLEEEPWSLVTYQVMRACVKQQKPVLFFTWQNICKRYPPPFSSFERFTFAHARAAIAGNQEARDILKARNFSRTVEVIPQLGVDPALFCKRDANDLKYRLGLKDKFVVGYVGRVTSEKGLGDLIEALAALPAHTVLVLVGDGSFRRSAEQLAERRNVSSRIHWVPHVPSLQVPDYMNVLDVLALPSRTTHRWKEQFGRVLVEAMACQTPPVGSSSGEIPNVIGDAGLVFPEGDVTALANHLRLLHDNPDLRVRLGAKGRARVLERFTHQHIAHETVKLYEQALSGVQTHTAEAISNARLLRTTQL